MSDIYRPSLVKSAITAKKFGRADHCRNQSGSCPLTCKHFLNLARQQIRISRLSITLCICEICQTLTALSTLEGGNTTPTLRPYCRGEKASMSANMVTNATKVVFETTGCWWCLSAIRRSGEQNHPLLPLDTSLPAASTVTRYLSSADGVHFLRAHMAKHEKRYKCHLPGCTNTTGFARPDQLERHQQTVRHHQRT